MREKIQVSFAVWVKVGIFHLQCPNFAKPCIQYYTRGFVENADLIC